MVPETQKKRQFGALIDKIDFLIGRLLINNATNPVLLKQQEMQAYMNNIAPLAAVKTDDIDGRKRWIQLLEQRLSKA